MTYATPTDWANRFRRPEPAGDELADLVEQLQAAADKVDELLSRARYRVDTFGNPTELRVAEALRQATLDQWAYTRDVDPDDLGVAYGAITVGPVALPAGGAAASGRFAPNAVARLRRERLLTMHVRSY